MADTQSVVVPSGRGINSPEHVFPFPPEAGDEGGGGHSTPGAVLRVRGQSRAVEEERPVHERPGGVHAGGLRRAS